MKEWVYPSDAKGGAGKKKKKSKTRCRKAETDHLRRDSETGAGRNPQENVLNACPTCSALVSAVQRCDWNSHDQDHKEGPLAAWALHRPLSWIEACVTHLLAVTFCMPPGRKELQKFRARLTSSPELQWSLLNKLNWVTQKSVARKPLEFSRPRAALAGRVLSGHTKAFFFFSPCSAFTRYSERQAIANG